MHLGLCICLSVCLSGCLVTQKLLLRFIIALVFVTQEVLYPWLGPPLMIRIGIRIRTREYNIKDSSPKYAIEVHVCVTVSEGLSSLIALLCLH